MKKIVDKIKIWSGKTTITPIENGLRCIFTKKRNGMLETDSVDLIRNPGYENSEISIETSYYKRNNIGEWFFDYITLHSENREKTIKKI